LHEKPRREKEVVRRRNIETEECKGKTSCLVEKGTLRRKKSLVVEGLFDKVHKDREFCKVQIGSSKNGKNS
jgi:hypothetical protein